MFVKIINFNNLKDYEKYENCWKILNINDIFSNNNIYCKLQNNKNKDIMIDKIHPYMFVCLR